MKGKLSRFAGHATDYNHGDRDVTVIHGDVMQSDMNAYVNSAI
jgi:hypothetical protein